MVKEDWGNSGSGFDGGGGAMNLNENESLIKKERSRTSFERLKPSLLVDEVDGVVGAIQEQMSTALVEQTVAGTRRRGRAENPCQIGTPEGRAFDIVGGQPHCHIVGFG